MKKLIIALFVVGLSVPVMAQTATAPESFKFKKRNANLPPAERSKKEADRARQELGLDPTQTTKWESASLDRMKANDPLKEKLNGSTTPDERMALRKQMKSNGDKFDETVNGFLNADQKIKFEQMKKNRHERRFKKVKPAPSQN